MLERLEHKSVPTGFRSVKDVDVSTRMVAGYYAALGSKDSDKERIAPGAFEESILEWGPDSDRPRIKHLNQHRFFQPIGRPRVLKEDDHGLYFETEIIDSRAGTDVLKGYALDLFEHSIGFNRLGEEVVEEDDSVLLTKIKLWEGSNVTWGANPNTPFRGFKGQREALDFLQGRCIKLRKLASENISDELGWQLELGLAQLEREISRLDIYTSNDGQPEAEAQEEGKEQDEEEEEVKVELPPINFIAAKHRKPKTQVSFFN